MTEPTMYEVVRRLDDVSKRLDSVVTTLEDRYVPRREYELRVGELEKDAKDQSNFRRQITAGVLLLLLGIVANIVISLAGTPGVGS